MKLFGANLSPFVRKAIVTLNLKGITYDHEVVMPGDNSPAYRAISPLGKIPALVDGDLSICDSSVICDYLDDAYPSPATRPADPKQRARARWLEEFADTRVAETTAVIFRERLVKPKLLGQQPDEARLAKVLAEEQPGVLAYLEQQVPAAGFLFGDFLTADIALVSPIITAEYAGLAIDGAHYPRLAAFLQRVKEHPAVAAALRDEAAMLRALA